MLHRQCHYAVNLAAVRIAAVIFPPCRFLREADQVRAGNVVVVADLAAPHAAEKTLRHVRIDVELAAEAVRLLMVDAVQLVPGMKLEASKNLAVLAGW